jgi:chaperonin cofactor prefoldin
LRLQVETLQKQLQLMQQRIQQLEEALNKKNDDG